MTFSDEHFFFFEMRVTDRATLQTLAASSKPVVPQHLTSTPVPGFGACPGGTTRKPWLRCKPGCSSIFGTMPLSLDSGGTKELTGGELRRERERTALFPQTISHRSLQRGPPNALFHLPLRARDVWSPYKRLACYSATPAVYRCPPGRAISA